MALKKVRSSNIELLRVFSMFMIILYHIMLHSVREQILGNVSTVAQTCFSKPTFYPQLLLFSVFMPLGTMGNAIFVLISGYFTAAKTNSLNLERTGKSLLFQFIFSGTVLLIASTLIYRFFVRENTVTTLLTIENIQSFSWFVGYYFLIIIVAYLFLNKKLFCCTQGQYRVFLIVLFSVVQFKFSGTMVNSLASGLRTLCIGIFLYAFGGYCRLYEPLKRLRSSFLLLVLAGYFMFSLISGYNMLKQGIENYFIKGGTLKQAVPDALENYFLIAVVLGITVFELFRRLKLPSLKIVNYLGKATFMVYLIHDNELFYSLWNLKNWAALLYEKPLKFLLWLCFYAVSTFFIGVIFYGIYTGLKKLVVCLKPFILKEKEKTSAEGL